MYDNYVLTVGILCGGASAEHKVSLQSGYAVLNAIDRTRFAPVLIGIDRYGQWRLGVIPEGVSGAESGFWTDAHDPRAIDLNLEGCPVALTPGSRGLLLSEEDCCLDVVFPVLHGPMGEDGTMQGLLRLANVPFVGSGVLASAVGMDKDVMKRLLRDAGIPVGRFLAFSSRAAVPSFEAIAATLGGKARVPAVFVKPANMGSSVGIGKARGEEEFSAAVDAAFQHDRKIVIEECIVGREIECAVLGNDEPAASVPGEVVTTHEFYSYEAKYLDENGARLEIPARLDEAVERRVRELAVRTFQTIGARGLARVDFFVKESGEVLVNEINTMPGFTKNSMYPKLWAASGIGFTQLVSRLIDLAMEK